MPPSPASTITCVWCLPCASSARRSPEAAAAYVGPTDVGALSAEEEAQVRAVLAKLAAHDARADSTVGLNGTLEAIKIKETELRDGDPLALYAKQGRRLVGRLAIVFGVDVGRDYYGDGGGDMGGAIGLG